MYIYSSFDNSIGGSIPLLESQLGVAQLSIQAIKTASGIRAFDLWTPAGYDPANKYRLLVAIPGQAGSARSKVEDYVQFLLEANNIEEDFIVVGIYSKPYITTNNDQDDWVGFKTLEEVDSYVTSNAFNDGNLDVPKIQYQRFSVRDSADTKDSKDIEFVRTVLSLIRKNAKIKEIIVIAESNGSAMIQTALNERRDKINTFISCWGTPVAPINSTISPINILMCIGNDDGLVPVGGGLSSTGYTFEPFVETFENWCDSFFGNHTGLVDNEFGWVAKPDYVDPNPAPPDNSILNAVLTEKSKTGSNKMVKYLIAAADAPTQEHGMAKIDDITLTPVSSSHRDLLYTQYFYDFIEKYPTEKLV